MTLNGAFDGSMESQDIVVRLCRMRIGFVIWDHSSQMMELVQRRLRVGSQSPRMHSTREESFFQQDRVNN